jgi:hypothetical protein
LKEVDFQMKLELTAIQQKIEKPSTDSFFPILGIET